MITSRLLPLVLVAAGVLRAGDALACGVLEGNGASWVDGADVIVRARAVEQKGRKHNTIEEARKAGGRLGTTIVFERLEALKGRVPAALEFEGEFVDGPTATIPSSRTRWCARADAAEISGTMPAYCPDAMDLFPEMRCGFALGQG